MSVPQSLRVWLLPVLAGLVFGLAIVWGLPAIEQSRSSPPLPRVAPAGQDGEPVASYAHAVDRARGSVVSIYTNTTVSQPLNPLFDDPFFRQFMPRRERRQTSLGSGVLLDGEGHVLTNAHVIRSADQIVAVTHQGQERTARLLGADNDSDLAVLKIDGEGLNPIPVDREYRARVGDVVFAVGNPFGVGQTVSMGIVSATGRHQPGLTRFADFIQTDAAINPGNSGGALINAAGDLVGINTAIFSNSGGFQGIGFAIPYVHALDIAQRIIEQGSVIRGYLGIDIRPLSPEERARLGLRSRAYEIVSIVDDSPADDAGLRVGDLLLGIEGQTIPSREAAARIISDHRPGERLELTLMRDRQLLRVEVRLGERPR